MSVAPPSSGRRAVHLRRISCEGFVRDDGLYEVEGLLVDTKPQLLKLVNRDVPAGEAIHQMRIRLTMDRDRCIVDAQAFSEHHPYETCAEVEAGYRRLIGLRVEPGFTRQVKRIMRGVEGCTHMTELLPPMASTLFQVIWADGSFAQADSEARDAGAGNSPLGGCHALRLDGQVVRTYFSRHHREANE
jgi:hypothetical protein